MEFGRSSGGGIVRAGRALKLKIGLACVYGYDEGIVVLFANRKESGRTLDVILFIHESMLDEVSVRESS